MKKMKVKVTAAALATMMAVAATGCTLKLNGDVGEMVSSMAENVEVIVDDGKAAPADADVKDVCSSDPKSSSCRCRCKRRFQRHVRRSGRNGRVRAGGHDSRDHFGDTAGSC